MQDMNSIAARALANMLLPSSQRLTSTSDQHHSASKGGSGSSKYHSPGGGSGSNAQRGGGAKADGSRAGLLRSPSPGAHHQGGPAEVSNISDRLRSMHLTRSQSLGSNAQQQQQQQLQCGMDQHPGVGPGSSGEPMRLLSDVVSHMCCHPHHRLLSLRSLPQVIQAWTACHLGNTSILRQRARCVVLRIGMHCH